MRWCMYVCSLWDGTMTTVACPCMHVHPSIGRSLLNTHQPNHTKSNCTTHPNQIKPNPTPRHHTHATAGIYGPFDKFVPVLKKDGQYVLLAEDEYNRLKVRRWFID